jgi:hypothetical protein
MATSRIYKTQDNDKLEAKKNIVNSKYKFWQQTNVAELNGVTKLVGFLQMAQVDDDGFCK